MTFESFTTEETDAESPLTQAFFDKMRQNFDDLDARAQVDVGDIKASFNPAVPTGWVLLDDGTIGNAASNASNRANADTEALFAIIWDNFDNSEAPIFDSLGAPSTRGASAAVDYAANKAIQLGTVASRVIGAVGTGSGLSARGIGDVVGSQTQGLASGNNGPHTHVVDGSITGESGINRRELFEGGTGSSNVTSRSSGSGTAHNNMQPTVFVFHYCKL